MSLRKLFLGKPGNIEEFADIAIKRSLPVHVLFFTEYVSINDTVSPIKGKIIYSIGQLEDFLVKKGVKYQKTFTHSIFDPEVKKQDGFSFGKDMMQLLKKRAVQDLNYLSKREIKYELLFWNHADEPD